MAYGEFKDLSGRTASTKVLHDKIFNIDKISKYDGYQRGIASIVYTFFDKKSSGVLLHVQINLISKIKLQQNKNEQKFNII